MTTAVWTGLVASALYLVASLVAARQLKGNLPVERGVFLGLGMIALLFHACALWHLTVREDGIFIGLFPIASVIGATGVAVVCISSIYRHIEWISLLVFPFSALSIPAALWIDTGITPSNLAHGLGAHVLFSIIGYAILALAACQALLVWLQHEQLKHGHIRGVMRFFPAIQIMESMLFELLWSGMAFLTAAMAFGFMYVDDLFAQHLVHKTVLTLLSWLVFAVLLTGRHLLGWRGVTAIRLTLAGFILLLVAFFGSQVVLQLILQRG